MDNTVEVQELGKVMITPKGEYSSSKTYEILDAVSYNGSSYVSKINDNTSVPTSDDWQLLAQKGDVYDVTEEDLQAIAKQITDNAKSAFNQNVETKTKEFNTNATNKENDYDTNAKKKLDEYNANDTKKLKAYNDNADSKLGAYNTNDTNKLDAYNKNADSKIEKYNTNANSKIAEYDEHAEELRNMAVSTDNELERVKNEILDTGSASDSFIHVEDSCMAKLKELGIDGVCKQETTRGYNILDENSWKIGYHITGNSLNVSNNGCHVDFQEIGSITQYFIRIEALKKCRIGRFFSAFTNESQDTSINKVSEGIYDTVFSAGQVKYITVNVPDGAFYVGFSIYLIQKIVNGEYVDVIPIHENYKDYFKICISTSYQENYEPFTNGASPNPDYPQEVKTITGNLKITSCNKNLFNKEKTPDNFYYNSTGEKTNDGVNKFINQELPYSKKYTISFSGTSDSTISYVRIAEFDKDNNFIKRTLMSSNNSTIEMNSRTKKVISCVDCGPNAYFENLQIEVGDKATLFEKHMEKVTEINLPDDEFIGCVNSSNRDILNFEYNETDGLYHQILNKLIKKVIIDGTKGSISMPATNRFNIDNAFDDYLKTSSSYGIYAFCFNYVVVPQAGSNSDFDNFATNYDYALDFGCGTANNIRIKNVKFSNIDDFKNDLKLHPITLYYILKPESRYELDIGTIKMPLSYKEITNVFTDSDLLPKINVEYYRTFQTTIKNMQINEKSLKQEIADLNNNIFDITKRLEVLESANVSIAEESEDSNDLQN